MKEHPILFTGDMVRAILDSRKTETRRVIKPQPELIKGWATALLRRLIPGVRERDGLRFVSRAGNEWCTTAIDKLPHYLKCEPEHYHCPYGKPGDRLWVRETFYHHGKWIKNGKTKTGKQAWKFKPTKHDDGQDVRLMDNPPEIVRPNKYRKPGWYKRPSIFMPRWASRILLEVTEVKVERVQEIMEHPEEILVEGVEPGGSFSHLWDSINAKRGFGWDVNPWVWVVSFKGIKP